MLGASLLISTQAFASNDEEQPKSLSEACGDAAKGMRLTGIEKSQFMKECTTNRNRGLKKDRSKE